MKLYLTPPTDRQREFLSAKNRYIAYGGARGGGKSHAVRLKAALLALRYKGISILIIRRSYPELYENHIRIMAGELSSVAVYRDSEKALSFKTGSRIKFGYCDGDSDLAQYQGREYDVIFIDEATHFSEYQFSVLKACLRGANSFPKRFYLTCNPGGPGHEWVKRLFIDRSYREGENPDDYVFIRSTVYDNKPLLLHDPGYIDNLRALPPDLRRAWLDGEWDIFAGQYFSEFSRGVHVCEPFAILPHWRVVRAIDYGLDMLACVWVALDERGCAYVIRELCEPGLIVSEAAARIKEMTHEPIYETVAPPDLKSRQKDTGKSIWGIFEECGIALTRADNNRESGWLDLKEWLRVRESPDGEGMTARLQIFDTCTELIRCLPAMQRDAKNPSDCSRVPHDITHICDALRYFVRSRPRAARIGDNRTWVQRARERAIRKSVRSGKRGH